MTQPSINDIARKNQPQTIPQDNRDGSAERLKVIKAWIAAVMTDANVSEQRARTAIVKVIRELNQ